MPAADVLSRSSRRPDLVLSYGQGPDQVADVRIPAARPHAPGGSGAVPPPLVLFLHGGFWRAAHDRCHTGPLADALTGQGFVVCTPEYRKVGQPGGGWPGTFADVAAAVDVLPGLVAASGGPLTDTSRLIVGGHSAGGQLALWAGARQRSSPGGERARLAVVSLSGVCDLAACHRDGLDDDAAGDLMGGGPEAVPDRYAQADPMSLVPLGVPIGLVHGTADSRVPWQQSRDFAAKAQAAGDLVTLDLLDGCGHFEVIDPLSAAWPTVLGAFQTAAARLTRP